MQLYYFHLLDGERMTPDAEGVRLPDITVVQQCARMIVRDLKAEPCLRQTDWSRWQVEVRDEAGVRVLLLPFQEEAADPCDAQSGEAVRHVRSDPDPKPKNEAATCRAIRQSTGSRRP